MAIDPTGFAGAFAREPFAVEHHLVEHPLLTLEGIAELADELPRSAVERHRADQPLVARAAPRTWTAARRTPSAPSPRTTPGWSSGTSSRPRPGGGCCTTASTRSQAHVRGRDGGMMQREGFLFLSAPGAVTPWHFDPEHNLLLQIRGTKEMNVGRFPTRPTSCASSTATTTAGTATSTTAPATSRPFVLEPGQGVYVPPFAPHWVRNGDAISISLSITFRTRRSRAAERAHGLNARLRRLGLHPRPAGHDERKDRAKAAIVHGVDWVRCTRDRAEGPARRVSSRSGDVAGTVGGQAEEGRPSPSSNHRRRSSPFVMKRSPAARRCRPARWRGACVARRSSPGRPAAAQPAGRQAARARRRAERPAARTAPPRRGAAGTCCTPRAAARRRVRRTRASRAHGPIRPRARGSCRARRLRAGSRGPSAWPPARGPLARHPRCRATSPARGASGADGQRGDGQRGIAPTAQRGRPRQRPASATAASAVIAAATTAPARLRRADPGDEHDEGDDQEAALHGAVRARAGQQAGGKRDGRHQTRGEEVRVTRAALESLPLEEGELRECAPREPAPPRPARR